MNLFCRHWLNFYFILEVYPSSKSWTRSGIASSHKHDKYDALSFDRGYIHSYGFNLPRSFGRGMA